MGHASVILLLLSASALFAEHRVQLTWEGTVEGPTTLRIHGDRVEVDSRSTYTEPVYRFNEPLPAARQTVRMVVNQGRPNTVRILEQPTPANDYTLVVRMNPRAAARDFYSLAFEWEGGQTAYRRDDTYDRRNTRSRTVDRAGYGSANWSGYVDREVIVSFRNRRAFTTAVRGQNVTDGRADFTVPMPRTEMNVRLENVQGRGRVELLEHPTRANGYTAKVRITDVAAGEGSYRLTLAWDDAGAESAAETGSVLSPVPGSPATGTASNLGFNGMRWSARVDGRIRVTVDGTRAWSERISGGPIVGEEVVWSGQPLGSYATNNVSLRRLSGRDEVSIVQEPSASNGYRLIFEVDDDDGGADDYVVEVRW